MSGYVKKFIFKIVFYFGVLAFLLVTFNFVADPYGVFEKKFTPKKNDPNQHFIKIKLLVSKQIHKDSFIFGSSRVGKIYTFNSKYTRNYYNMTYAEGVPCEHLQDIRILLNNGVKIKNIIMGVDDISYLVDPKLHVNDPMLSPYPESKQDLYFYYFKYLLTPRYFFCWKPLHTEFRVYYDIFHSGNPIVIGKDQWIENNKIEHNQDKKFAVPSWENHYKERINLTIQEMKEIKDICQLNNINLVIFVNPMNEVTYRKQNMIEYFSFLKKLAAITNYLDFAGINKITSNNYYYYETSHYRPLIGDLIVNRIFSQNEDSEFGFVVTSKNVNEHLVQLKNELK